MVGFRIAFLVCALVSLTCFVLAIRVKRKNIGFLLTTALVVACDIICFILLGSKNIVGARNVLIAFYICHAWLYFGVLWTVAAMGRSKKYTLIGIPVILICIYQTVLIASNAFGSRVLSFSKHIFLGNTWWIAEPSKTAAPLFSLPAYRILCYVSAAIILVEMVLSCIRTSKVFRGKFYVLIVTQILLVVLEVVTAIRLWPVWVMALLANLVCVGTFYLVVMYSNRKLRDWSLMSFANEMSDGFILYNEYNDPIHMNDLLKNVLSEDLIREFRNKDYLDEWLAKTISVDNMEVLPYTIHEEEHFFKVNMTELGHGDDKLGTIYILHDTTESIMKIRAMEEANVELERAAKMKSDFLANMSHEIRTPMNAVIGMAEIALREELPPNVVDYLAQIQTSGRNLLNIINDILDFSKIEAGKMEIITDRYEPLSEVNDIANILVTRIGDKPVELFVTSDTNIPHALDGDAMRIRQVIINLANNAIKFTKEGMVHIQILCEHTSEDEVVLTYHIKDTGSGIRPEDIKKLFVSFQQVDSKRNRSVEGTGLGLAISQKLVEAMGGTIGVTSEYGKGSDFYFTIPQKIVDPDYELVVEDAENKYAIVLHEDDGMIGMFVDEMNKLGVQGSVLPRLEDYQPSGKKDYLFFEEDRYQEDVREFLDQYKECVGIVLVQFDSAFEPNQPNLKVMRRPETTLNMVMTLNDKEIHTRLTESSTAFKIDFTAPEAKILIVDDNAINITIAEGLLRPVKAKCYSALRGKEAIKMIQNEPFDIVFMDHMMPEMDGIETTREIRSTIPSVADMPIIALTANAMEGVKDMFIKEGMNDFVAKPIDVRDLVTKLKEWLPPEKIIEGEVVEEAAPEEGTELEVSYDGLDCEKAIKSLGSPALFQKIVKEYYRSGKDKYDSIVAAYESEDWPDYSIKVHALKSSSRQIGADALGSLAEEMENAGKALDVDTIHSKNDGMLAAYEELLQKLSQYFPEEETANQDLPEIPAEELERILGELESACDDLDMDTMEEKKEELMKYSFPDSITDSMKELYQAIDDIDIDTCMEIIVNIRERG